MSIITWFAGGPAHGQHTIQLARSAHEAHGADYRFFSGPYTLSTGQPYQVFVDASLDDDAADAAVILLLQQRLSVAFPVAF